MAKYRGLPTPFIQNVLATLRQASDPGTVALANKIDYWAENVAAEIAGMLAIHRPEQAPYVVLQELAYMVGANVVLVDSEDTIRKKIFAAVDSQKKKGQWLADAKPKIDVITGLNSVLWSGINDFWPVRIGNTPGMTYGSNWSIRGAGDNAAYPGIIRTGTGTEAIIEGNIYIDLGGTAGNPTAATIAAVVAAISLDVVPAYFKEFLGYVVAGAFTVYAGGQIG